MRDCGIHAACVGSIAWLQWKHRGWLETLLHVPSSRSACCGCSSCGSRTCRRFGFPCKSSDAEFFVQTFSSRVSASIVREWTLARYGHHPFLDGRSAHHRSQAQPCLCSRFALLAPLLYRGDGHGSHLFGLKAVDVEQLLGNVFPHSRFSPQHPQNTVGLLSAHRHFVDDVCHAQRSL